MRFRAETVRAGWSMYESRAGGQPLPACEASAASVCL